MSNRDIVVIGASTGGVELLLDLAAALPARLPAALFVVLHTAAGQLSALPELLAKRGPLPAAHPQHGDEIVNGRIYVAPPDTHLLVRPGFVEVVRGPKENGHRPAVDPLFRTASWSYGPRVIGVVLSGFLDCGTAGLMSVKARGGIAVVQDPESATAPDMPRNALQGGAADHVVQPAELPGLLSRLVGEPGPAVLQHLQHAFSLDSLLGEQSEDVERALWAAVHSLEEGAALSRRLTHSSSNAELQRRFADKDEHLTRQADVIRRILLQGEPPMLEQASPPSVQDA